MSELLFRDPSTLGKWLGETATLEATTRSEAIRTTVNVADAILSIGPTGVTWHGLRARLVSLGLTPQEAEAQIASFEHADILRRSSNFTGSAYHRATRDHPFLDMSTGIKARVEDAAIMAGFVTSDEYPSAFLDLPSTDRVDIPDATDLATDELRCNPFYQFAMIISGTFGIRRRQYPYHDPDTGYHQVELLLKSIPSGGARHPSELFLEISKSPHIDPGSYHFNTRTSTLDRIGDEGRFHLPELRPQQDADWVVRTVIASSVERAMFRYRDPRSFRALLVDAGHADGQMAALAAYCNWSYSSALHVEKDFGSLVDNRVDSSLPSFLRGTLIGWE